MKRQLNQNLQAEVPILRIILWKILVFGALLAVASIAGDLTESALKRKCGVKDSGNIIPGMGGPLDVLDSFIYNGMLFSVLWYVSKLDFK